MGEKYTFDLPPDVVEALTDIDPDLGKALTKAIATRRLLKQEESEGARLLIEKDGEIRELNVK